MIKFKDIRDEVPRHRTREFRRRAVDQIVGIAVHHTAGGDDPFATARYHVSPNHVSKDGCPSINYTFFIDKEGTLFLCNDLDSKTWSIGKPPPFAINGQARPSSNTFFLSVVVGGSFNSRHNKTGEEPTVEQVLALMMLITSLTREDSMRVCPFEASEADQATFRGYVHGALSHLSSADLYGHFDFGKGACPADTLESLIRALRSQGRRFIERTEISSVHDWQGALEKLGLYTSKVDGLWGPQSRKALISFEESLGLRPEGVRSDRVRRALEEALEASRSKGQREGDR